MEAGLVMASDLMGNQPEGNVKRHGPPAWQGTGHRRIHCIRQQGFRN